MRGISKRKAMNILMETATSPKAETYKDDEFIE